MRRKNELINFKTIDYLVIIIYLLFGGFISISYNYFYLEIDTVKSLVQFFLVLAPILLFTAYYKRLRVLKVFLLWILLSVVQIATLFPLKEMKEFQNLRGSYFDSMYNLLIMLSMLFVFRMIYSYFFKQELIIATKLYDGSERKVNYFDYFFTILGILILTVLCPILFMNLDFF